MSLYLKPLMPLMQHMPVGRQLRVLRLQRRVRRLELPPPAVRRRRRRRRPLRRERRLRRTLGVRARRRVALAQRHVAPARRRVRFGLGTGEALNVRRTRRFGGHRTRLGGRHRRSRASFELSERAVARGG